MQTRALTLKETQAHKGSSISLKFITRVTIIWQLDFQNKWNLVPDQIQITCCTSALASVLVIGDTVGKLGKKVKTSFINQKIPTFLHATVAAHVGSMCAVVGNNGGGGV